MGVAWMIGAFASAIGIGVGGGLAWIMKGVQHGFNFIYALCTGLIIGLLFLEMIPESIELGGWFVLMTGVAAGLLLFIYIHRLMNKITIITDSHQDRKSTRLNSSHVSISYVVFCLKKKNKL